MTVRGVDISRYQPADIDIGALDFVIVKASQGAVADPLYRQHAAAVKRARKVLGAYCFGVDDMSGADQAAVFLRTIGSDTKLAFLDIEGNHAPSDLQALDWMTHVRAEGKLAGIYHSISGYPFHLHPDVVWIADWRGQEMSPEIHWDFWQTSSRGHLPGFPGRVDTDLFHGTLMGLRRLAGTARPLPGKPPHPHLYTVQAGDSLSSIAAAHKTTWRRIWTMNRHVIGPNPNLIRRGQVLHLP